MEFKTQKELFEHVWETRPHVSEISGLPLYPKGDMLHYHQYLHVLSKGAYPQYKLRLENIMLATPSEHQNQEQYEVFRNKRDELKEQYYKEFNVNTMKL